MKQVDFAISVVTISATGLEGAFTNKQAAEAVKSTYPFSKGWKVESVSHVQSSAEGYTFVIFLAQYKDA